MTIEDINSVLGIKRVRKVTTNTTVVELQNGTAFPLTPFGIKMWDLIKIMSLEE